MTLAGEPWLRRAASSITLAFVLAAPSTSKAELVCDAGAACPDDDGDGFARCGCPWSGTPCDCDDGDPSVFPGAPETCDSAKDKDCSGVAGDPCPAKQGCLGSACVPECIYLDDFGCASGSSFSRQPDSGRCLCAPEDCTVFGCPEGLTCDDAKTCVPSCSPAVRCPHGQVCRGSGCVDPCAEVTCPQGSACEGGRCVPSCACDPGASCPPGRACDLSAPVPVCVEQACAGVTCPAGEHCERGGCVDDCEGVVCPPKRVCRKVSVNAGPARGKCVDLCAPDPCSSDATCDWRTGRCVPRPTADGGLVGPTVELEYLEVGGAGWLCSASAVARASALTVAMTTALILLLFLRRRTS